MTVTPYATNAATYLIETLFGLYLLIVVLRFLFQIVRADFYNPISQFLVKATNPPLRPLRRVIPGVRGIDLASVVLLLAVQFAEVWLVYGIYLGRTPQMPGLMVLTVAKLLSLILWIYFFSILIQVVMSWVSPGTYNPVTSLLYSLNEPVLGRARRLLPPMSGLDLSPFVFIVAMQLVRMLVVDPLTDVGQRML